MEISKRTSRNAGFITRGGERKGCNASRRPAHKPLFIRVNRDEELDVEVLHVERIFFDELATGFDVFAHQRGEDGLALRDVLEPDGEQRAAFGIHGRLP